MNRDERSRKNKSNIGVFFVSFIIIAIVVIVVIILSYSNEKNISVEHTSSQQGVLKCDSGPLEDSFFSIDNTSQVKHQLKVSFIDNQIDNLFYMYSGKLNDETAAEYGAIDMNIKYDKYLGENKYASSSELNATFNHPGTDVRIDIYTDAKGINPATASLFFLDKDDLDSIMYKNGEELKDYYRKKGFNCRYE